MPSSSWLTNYKLLEQKHEYKYSDTQKPDKVQPFSCSQMMVPNHGNHDEDDHWQNYQPPKPFQSSSRQSQGQSAAQSRPHSTPKTSANKYVNLRIANIHSIGNFILFVLFPLLFHLPLGWIRSSKETGSDLLMNCMYYGDKSNKSTEESYITKLHMRDLA